MTEPAADTNALATAAHAYASGGLDVFPLHSITLDGRCTCERPDCASPGKHPRTRHGVDDATDDHDQITDWWRRWPGANIGVATAAPGLYVIDIDGDRGAHSWNSLCQQHDGEPATRTVRTGNGRHLWFITDRQLGNTASKLGPGIDSRGTGGYVVAPPSNHATGSTYQFENPGSPLASLPAWIGDILAKPPATQPTVPLGTDGSDQLAEKRLRGLAGNLAIMPPDSGRNNALNHAAYVVGQLIGAGRLDPDRAVQTLEVAATRSGLTESEIGPTIRSGIEAGRTNPDHERPDTTGPVPPVTPLVVPDQRQQAAYSRTDGHVSSWAPVDGSDYIDGTWTPPEPTQLERHDRTCLFYGGRINLLFGESEAGKGWVALHAVAQALDRGDTVLYIDFEDYPDTIYARLKLLGVGTGPLGQRFSYIRPDHALDDLGKAALGGAVAELEPQLVVLDGVTGAMSLHGLDTNSSTDVDQFYSLLGEPLARTGAAIVFIDHVTKSAESRGKGPIGSQHKRARVSGASYEVAGIQPIAPGRSGRLRLKIDKDRLGAVRCTHPAIAGDFVLDSTDPDRTSAVLYGPSSREDGDDRRLRQMMVRLSAALADAGEAGLSIRGLNEVGGTAKEVIRDAIDELVNGGWVTRHPGPNRSLIHRHKVPFTDGPTVLGVPEGVPVSPSVPNASGTPVGGKRESGVPVSPAFSKRGTRDTDEPDPENTTRKVPL